MKSTVVVYTFDPASKEFTGAVSLTSTRDPRSLMLPPIVKGMPLYSTTVVPPQNVPPRKVAVWAETRWHLAEDWRGVELFDTLTGAAQRIAEIGVTPEMRFLTDTPRPSPEYSWDGGNWVHDPNLRLTLLCQRVRLERNRRLVEADRLVNIALDNDLDAKPARTYRQALRDVTRQSGFPENVLWPALPQPT